MAVCSKCGAKPGIFSPVLRLVGQDLLCATCEAAQIAIVNKKYAEKEAEQLAADNAKKKQIQENYNSVLIVSSFEVCGRSITKYFDFISTEHVLGTGFLAENISDISDLFGTTSGAYQDKFKEIKQYAVKSIKCAAYEIGANAVIGVDIKYTVAAQRNLIIVSLCGTPVVIE